MKSIYFLCATATAALAIMPQAHSQETGRQLFTLADAVVDEDGSATINVFANRWDDRCAADIKVAFNANALPNTGERAALAGPRVNTVFSRDETESILAASFDRWNDNPFSYINIEVAEQRDFLPLEDRENGFVDFTNEASFEEGALEAAGAAGALAVSASITLMEDARFRPGDDIDGDGDSDVFSPRAEGVRNCTDIDGDGDIDYPAGRYAAGTILENDVLYSSATDWEREPTVTGVDLMATTVHEYGHSHGLTHSTFRTLSPTLAVTPTMFPAIAATIPSAEESVRNLQSDDIAASAHLYPEGSARRGPAALQRGDRAFSENFSVIEGEVVDPDGNPIFGAAVFAVDNRGNNVAVTYSGTVNQILVDSEGNLSASADTDGNFKLAVPRGLYTLTVEPVDGSPVPAGSISISTILAAATGINVYPEETHDWFEAALEPFFELTSKFISKRGRERITTAAKGRPIQFITNVENEIENVFFDPNDPLDAFRFDPQVASFSFSDTGIIRYIERFTREDVLAMIDNDETIVGANLATGTFSFPDAPVFTSVKLMTGTVDPDTDEVTLLDDLEVRENFVGQIDDVTALDFTLPSTMTGRINAALEADDELDLFLVVETDIDNTARDFEGFPAPFLGSYLVDFLNFTPTSYLQLPGEEILLTDVAFPIPLNWAVSLRSVKRD